MNIQYKPRLFTVDEFMRLSHTEALEKSGGGLELHDGQIVQMNAKYLPHVRMQALFVRVIGNLLHGSSTLICVSEPSVQLDPHNSREPDVAVYQPRSDMTTVLLPDAVHLLIEIANDSLATDLGDKAQRYAAAAIPEYWVIDLVGEVTHVHGSPSPDGYATRQVVRFAEPLTAACLPAPLVIADID